MGLFAVFFSYIPITFGAANYGKLIGLATLVSGTFGFVSDPLGRWASFSHNNKAMCSAGVTFTDRQACSRTSWVLAASMAPMLLYSMWLAKRKGASNNALLP